MSTHVIFVHGLSGHHHETWTVTGAAGSPELWPKWLAEDVPGLGLWLVGYAADKTNWRGHAMHLPARADNILARLLAEPRLERGNIVFVAHSLGGLVVEHLMRNAERDARGSRRSENFLSRVRRVAFLGTPHRGASLATWATFAARFLPLRPSKSSRDLVRDSSQLQDLNHWYRKYCRDNSVENLVLAEGRPEKVWGFSLPEFLTIVQTSSADAGLLTTPIQVDESHLSICKPASRESAVYVYLKDFISQPYESSAHTTQIVEALQAHSERINEQSQEVSRLTRQISEPPSVHLVEKDFLDAELASQLERLRQGRLFGSFKLTDEAKYLVSSLQKGSLSLASEKAKGDALAWCARFLSASDPDEAESVLGFISKADPELIAAAQGLIAAARDDLKTALGHLANADTPLSRGASYICVLKVKGFCASQKWLEDVGLSVSDLDSDSKFFYINEALQHGEWALALDAVSALNDFNFERSPGLTLLSAETYLIQAAPDELRMFLLQYLPFEAADFPLSGSPESLEYRRVAARLYARAVEVAKALGAAQVAEYAEDRALWLRLMDPDVSADARCELAESIKAPGTLLRRLNLALQFGVDVDVAQVEREVDRQTALSGGSSRDAAVARFTLASAQGSRAAAAAYIERHRGQLLEHLEWKAVYVFEIEMLATSCSCPR